MIKKYQWIIAGADHHALHWVPGSHILQLLRLPQRKGNITLREKFWKLGTNYHVLYEIKDGSQSSEYVFSSLFGTTDQHEFDYKRKNLVR